MKLCLLEIWLPKSPKLINDNVQALHFCCEIIYLQIQHGCAYYITRKTQTINQGSVILVPGTILILYRFSLWYGQYSPSNKFFSLLISVYLGMDWYTPWYMSVHASVWVGTPCLNPNLSFILVSTLHGMSCTKWWGVLQQSMLSIFW